MAKFVYRMQNILTIKEKLEEQEKIAFSLANARALEEQAKLSELLKRRLGYERQLTQLSQGNINVSDIRIYKSSIDAMKSLIRDQMIVLSRAQKQVEIARQRLNAVTQERKMHEKLKEKAFEEFKQELNAEESKMVDQLVSYTFGNKEEED